jgi:hypothetical protein
MARLSAWLTTPTIRLVIPTTWLMTPTVWLARPTVRLEPPATPGHQSSHTAGPISHTNKTLQPCG